MRAHRLWLILLFAGLCSPAFSFELPRSQSSIFVFGGQYMKGTFPGLTNIPYGSRPEPNFLAGAAYDLQLVNYGAFLVGAEIGVAARFGEAFGAEIWAGPSFRYRFHIGSFMTVTPGLVTGLSVVTRTLGIERQRELMNNGNATLLFYLGPEIAWTFNSLPNVEFVFRTQHRSGAKGTLGRMGEGANANIFGVRLPL